MIMTKIFLTITFALTVFLTGCMTIIQSYVGIKDANKLTDSQIVKTSKSFKVDQNANYRLDTTYLSYILDLDKTTYKAQRKNHTQPLQALYFDSKGQLVKFYINCYAGGLPNLKWNRNGNLETFLPKDQAPLDTILNLTKQLSYLRPVCTSTKDIVTENQDYYVFVYWTKCTKRHSKRLIKSIKKNVSKATTEKVKTIYVNYDNVHYKLENK
jgi:hypothetical protein